MVQIAIFVALIAAYFILGYFGAPKMRAARFRTRDDKPYEAIHAEAFASKGVSVESGKALWMEAARALRISSAKLRPSDRFDHELAYCLKAFPFVDLNDDFFAIVVNRLRERRLPRETAKHWETLGDYIVALGAVS